jgi:hypothetical protein
VFIFFCVILIFNFESSVRGEDKLQWFETMFVSDCDIYL